MRKREVDQAVAVALAAFEAGIGKRSWSSMIADLAEFHGAVGGVIFTLNRTNGQFGSWDSAGLSHSTRYVEEMNAINPRMQYSMSKPSPHVLTDFHCIGPKDMGRHEFYRWLDSENGLQHFIGARVLDRGDVSTFVSVEFEKNAVHPDASAVERFKMLCQQIVDARLLADNRKNQNNLGGLDDFLTSDTSTAMLFLDSHFRFLFCNGAGEHLLASGEQICVDDGLVTLSDSAANARLHEYLEYQRIGNVTGDLPKPLLLTVQGPYLRPPLLIRFVRFPYPMKGPGGLWSQYCLFVQGPASNDHNAHISAIQAFGLTPREAEFVLAFSKYHSIAQVAESLDIKPNTARVHMQNSLRKMGIRSQTQLIQLVEKLVAWNVIAPDKDTSS